MFNIIIKYSLNNIFLTVLIYKKKIYSKSTGQFKVYSKGKRKVSNLALLYLLNNFLNFYLTNFKKFVILALTIELYGCTLKRYFFLKKNLNLIIKKIKFKYLFFIDKNFFSFNGCRLKKKKRKKKKKKKNKIK
jgi:hypothetical protein